MCLGVGVGIGVVGVGVGGGGGGLCVCVGGEGVPRSNFSTVLLFNIFRLDFRS